MFLKPGFTMKPENFISILYTKAVYCMFFVYILYCIKKLWAAVREKFTKMSSKREIQERKIPKKYLASSIIQSKKPSFLSANELMKPKYKELDLGLDGGSNFSQIPTLPETPKNINPAVEVSSTFQTDTQPIKN